MKKVKFITLFLILCLTFPLSTLAKSEGPELGPGEWDAILSYPMTVYSSYYRNTPVANSGGGDIRACVYNINPHNQLHIRIYF